MIFNPERIYTLPEVAKKLNLADATIYKMVHLKRIPYIKYSNLLNFSGAQLNKWMEDHSVPVGRKAS